MSRYAIVLGDQGIGKSVVRLNSVAHDVLEIAGYFYRNNWEISGTVLLDFGANEIANLWECFFEKMKTANDADIVIYYSGHGTVEDGVWRPRVTGDNSSEHLDIVGKSIELSKRSNVKSVSIVIDSCFSAEVDDYGIEAHWEEGDPPIDVLAASRKSAYGTEGFACSEFTERFLHKVKTWDAEPLTWEGLRDQINASDKVGCELFCFPYGESQRKIPFEPERDK